MVSAKEAKEWAPEHLRGIIDAVYTPFCGKDGDEIDYDALRTVIRYFLGDLQHDGIYVCGTVSEFWALTKDERKKIAEVTIDEAKKVNPKAIKIVHTGCLPVKDCVELTNHAQQIGADLAIMLTPYLEATGAPGVYEYYRYVAERTDIPMALYNSGSTQFILSPEDIADLYNRIPAICAIKNGVFQYEHSVKLHRLVPKMVIGEMELLAAGRGGLMKYGYTAPVIVGGAGSLQDIPGKMLYTEHWKLLMEGKLTEAAEQYYTSGLAEIASMCLECMICPDRPGYVGHWGSAIKSLFSLLGMPIGDYPHSRPPQHPVPEAFVQRARDCYVKAGFIKPVLHY